MLRKDVKTRMRKISPLLRFWLSVAAVQSASMKASPNQRVPWGKSPAAVRGLPRQSTPAENDSR
jgi:hypothetical protein